MRLHSRACRTWQGKPSFHSVSILPDPVRCICCWKWSTEVLGWYGPVRGLSALGWDSTSFFLPSLSLSYHQRNHGGQSQWCGHILSTLWAPSLHAPLAFNMVGPIWVLVLPRPFIWEKGLSWANCERSNMCCPHSALFRTAFYYHSKKTRGKRGEHLLHKIHSKSICPHHWSLGMQRQPRDSSWDSCSTIQCLVTAHMSSPDMT